MVLTARSWGGAALRVVRAVVRPRPHPHLAPHRPHARPPGALLALLLSATLAACGGGGSSAGEAPTQAQALSSRAQLGEKLFKDPSLSGSGRQACISCHVPETGHAGALNGKPTEPGGTALELEGGRTAPSLRYLATNTPFGYDKEGTPTGGFFWDGRATSLMDQAGKPFFNPKEMANASVEELIGRVARASYAAEFQKEFGADIFKKPADALQRVQLALQAYQLEDIQFRPYSSKYDEFLRGRAALSDQELRGLALFNAVDKGNCAACHPSAKGADGSFPLFTDFTYDALGVPRNPALSQNADPAFYDLGLCARDGGDLLARQDLCGAFKVPSLRNVALRKAFFHNGRFSSLRDVVAFYVERDVYPEKWYPRLSDGSVDKFNDLPPALRANVNTTEGPYNRVPGQAPALNDREIDDVVAFLRTLSDGYAR
ncbi:c-type cytochrome [Pelomonas sp. CA6]|uniref:cytochrome-c peroxidase n=1 Tax=Pelomonas sp. CA6 TaxID=2907999 RepID=UPI001F4C2D0D|nr:cytochrome c peroxidase [Pelomonas sp. CA6]MCH7344944.1 c-type cytochrome [Pelomonas sp. CA6]